MARRSKASWEQNLPLRLHFERGAAAAYANFSRRAEGKRKTAQIVYRLTVSVTGYEDRRVEIRLSRTTRQPEAPQIYVDGPDESPHRFSASGEDPRRPLCIWYPDDPAEQKWTAADGLVSLIEMIRIHLFKEAYYREKGSWPGAEAPHGAVGSKV